MNDWMDKLESELGELAPRTQNRDLVAAALCAHHDSRVLTAKRLRRELTAEELESTLAVIGDKYPDLLAEEGHEAVGVAVAFIKTPAEFPVGSTVAAVQSQTKQQQWLSRMLMVAGLLICFAGGIAIGLRSGTTNSTLVDSRPLTGESDVVERSPVIEDPPGLELENVASEQASVVPVTRRIRTGFFGDRQKSSLPEYFRVFHQKRLQPSL